RIDRDLGAGGEGGEIAGAAAADAHDGAVLEPARRPAEEAQDLVAEQARVGDPLLVVGAAEAVPPVLLVVEEPAHLVEIAGVREVGDAGHAVSFPRRRALSGAARAPARRLLSRAHGPLALPEQGHARAGVLRGRLDAAQLAEHARVAHADRGGVGRLPGRPQLGHRALAALLQLRARLLEGRALGAVLPRGQGPA